MGRRIVKVTASKTALWVDHCAWWARPEVPVDPDRPSEWRNFGLAVHDALEVLHGQAAADAPQRPDLAAIADARELTTAQRLALPRAVDALVEVHVPLFAMSEVAWALDLDTGEGRILGYRIGRAYKEHGARDGIDFCGSADLAWFATTFAHEGYLIVIDLKSGFEGTVEDHKPQLMSNAAALASALGARGAILQVLHLFNGEVRWDTQIIEDYELEEHVHVLQQRRRETPTAEPVPGPHCRERYCTAIDACPAGQRAIAALVPVGRLPAKLRGKIESAEEAAARAALLPLLKEGVKRYQQELEEWAAEHDGVRTPDGRWWGEVAGEKRSLTPTPEAMSVLAEELGDVGAQRALKIALTQSSIREQLVALGITPPSAALERILEKLEKVGAVKKTPTSEYEFRNRPPLLKTTKGAA